MDPNLTRELQMQVEPPSQRITVGRTVRWAFKELFTLRHTDIQRVGRLTRPQGKLNVTLGVNPQVQAAICRSLGPNPANL